MPAVLSKIAPSTGVAPPATYIQPAGEEELWVKYVVDIFEVFGGAAGAVWLGRIIYRKIKKDLAARREARAAEMGVHDDSPEMAERVGNPANGPILELRNLIGRAAPAHEDEESVYHSARNSIAHDAGGPTPPDAPEVGNAVVIEADITERGVQEPNEVAVNEEA